MSFTVTKYKDVNGLKDLAESVQAGVNALADMGLYLANCGKAGKFFVPINSAYPFLMMMGKVVSGWFLFWQAGVARQKLDGLARQNGIDPADKTALAGLAKSNKDAAFYMGKGCRRPVFY